MSRTAPLSASELKDLATAISTRAIVSRNFVERLSNGFTGIVRSASRPLQMEVTLLSAQIDVTIEKIGGRRPFQAALFAPEPLLGMTFPRLLGDSEVEIEIFSNDSVDYSEPLKEFLSPMADWKELEAFFVPAQPLFLSSRNAAFQFPYLLSKRLPAVLPLLFAMIERRQRSAQ